MPAHFVGILVVASLLHSWLLLGLAFWILLHPSPGNPIYDFGITHTPKTILYSWVVTGAYTIPSLFLYSTIPVQAFHVMAAGLLIGAWSWESTQQFLA